MTPIFEATLIPKKSSRVRIERMIIRMVGTDVDDVLTYLEQNFNLYDVQSIISGYKQDNGAEK